MGFWNTRVALQQIYLNEKISKHSFTWSVWSDVVQGFSQLQRARNWQKSRVAPDRLLLAWQLLFLCMPLSCMFLPVFHFHTMFACYTIVVIQTLICCVTSVILCWWICSLAFLPANFRHAPHAIPSSMIFNRNLSTCSQVLRPARSTKQWLSLVNKIFFPWCVVLLIIIQHNCPSITTRPSIVDHIYPWVSSITHSYYYNQMMAKYHYHWHFCQHYHAPDISIIL